MVSMSTMDNNGNQNGTGMNLEKIKAVMTRHGLVPVLP